MNLIPIRYRSQWPICASYEEAAAMCGDGYENVELVAVVLAKTQAAIKRGFDGLMEAGMERWLMAFTQMWSGDPDVVDFGGGCGWHYFSLSPVLYNIGIVPNRWGVVETASMVIAGCRLAHDDFGFIDRLPEWKDIDIVTVSGSLQYTPDPYKALSDIVKCNPRRIFMTRTALLPSFPDYDAQIYTVQTSWLSENGPGPLPEGFKDRQVKYPLTLIGKDSLEQAMAGYRMVAHWDEGVAHRIGEREVRQYGYLWERE